MLESQLQSQFIKKVRSRIPGCIVLKNDATYIQGFPDLLFLHNDRWAAVEVKNSPTARLQPNQRYYVDLLSAMSFATLVHPGNEEEVLNALQQALGS